MRHSVLRGDDITFSLADKGNCCAQNWNLHQVSNDSNLWRIVDEYAAMMF